MWNFLFGEHPQNVSLAEVDSRRISRLAALTMIFGIPIAVLGCFIPPATWALAAFLSAGIVGFLFGIPRVVQGEPGVPEKPAADGKGAPPAARNGSRYEQRVNTNLEQISDWLTKIIVGIGLVELRQIPGAFQSLAEYLSDQTSYSPAVAGSVVAFFGCAGFLAGYLLTRLYLAGAFSRADQQRQEVTTLVDDLIETLPAKPEGDSTADAAKPEENPAHQIIDFSPALSVKVMNRELDRQIREIAEKHGFGIKNKTTATLVKELHQKKIVPDDIASSLKKLDKIGHLVADQGDAVVTPEAAEKYLYSADQIRYKLKSDQQTL